MLDRHLEETVSQLKQQVVIESDHVVMEAAF